MCVCVCVCAVTSFESWMLHIVNEHFDGNTGFIAKNILQ